MRLLLAIACAITCSAAATPAQAWTRTTVEGVRAHLDVDERGSALVQLEVDLRISGGWLSDFEILGLGEHAELDTDKPPWLVGDDGQKYVPQARHEQGDHDGRVVIRFPKRRQAPWRGRYTLGLLYRIPLGDGSGALRFTLPAWRMDLQHVIVRLEGPAGMRVLDSGSDSVEVVRNPRGARARIQLTRAQLPRTLNWEVELALPDGYGGNRDGALQGGTIRAHAPDDAPFSAQHLWVGVLVALMAWLKRGFVRREAARRGASVHPLLPSGPAWLGTLLILLSGIAAGWLYVTRPLVGVGLLVLCVALALGRGFRRLPRPRAVGMRRAVALDLQRAKQARQHAWLGGHSWLDGTTPSGLVLLASGGALAWLATHQGTANVVWLEGWVALFPLFFNATRSTLPSTTGQALLQLEQVRERLLAGRAGPWWTPELCVAAGTDHAAAVQPSLVIRGVHVPGLVALEVVPGLGRWQGKEHSQPMWLARAERGSYADVALEAALPHARLLDSASAGRAASAKAAQVVTRSVPLSDPGTELDALLTWLAVGARTQAAA